MFPVVLLLHRSGHPWVSSPIPCRLCSASHAASIRDALPRLPRFYFASASLLHFDCRRRLLAGCGNTLSTHAVLADACNACRVSLMGQPPPYEAVHLGYYRADGYEFGICSGPTSMISWWDCGFVPGWPEESLTLGHRVNPQG